MLIRSIRLQKNQSAGCFAATPLRSVHQTQILVQTRKGERVIITSHLQQGNRDRVQHVQVMLALAQYARVVRPVLQVRAPVMEVTLLVDGPAIATAQQPNGRRNGVLQQ